MFTGLVQNIGEVLEITKDGDWSIRIGASMDMNAVDIGASICCSGCCLTVVSKDDESFTAEVSTETLSKTNLGQWSVGRKINLEPSLKMGDELGGHFVFGHVDGPAVLIDLKEDQDSHRLTFEVPAALSAFIAPKGSVSLDGVSLTVNEVSDNRFGVNIIPHTWQHTTLGQIKEGDALNIEIDMLARYVARQLEQKAAA